MSDRFKQKTISLTDGDNTDRIKVSKLMGLIAGHPYLANVEAAFATQEIADDYIVIDHIATVFTKLSAIFKDYEL